MGADWSSASIIGVRVPKPMVETKERGCRHPEQNSRFCSECGSPMWKFSKDLHPKIAEIYDEDGKHSSGLQCCTSTDNEDYFIGQYMIGTRSNRSGDYMGKIDLPSVVNVEEIKVKLMQYLGDLYKEKEFGLWTVLHCSY